MRKHNFHSLTVFILIPLMALSVIARGQMPMRGGNQTAVTGWSDDSHYLFKTLDADKKSVTESVDIKTGKGIVVPAEKSKRELLSASLPQGYTIGMFDALSPDGSSVVINKENDLFYFKSGEKDVRRLTNDKAAEVNARFSPDGKKIAYTRNKDLYVFDIDGNKEIRLTADASDKIYNGYSSWVYMEEILERSSRYAAFWWSPNSAQIAYLRTDDSEVPVFTLNRLDEADGVHGLIEATPYPKPGDPNPKVKMGIADSKKRSKVN